MSSPTDPIDAGVWLSLVALAVALHAVDPEDVADQVTTDRTGQLLSRELLAEMVAEVYVLSLDWPT